MMRFFLLVFLSGCVSYTGNRAYVDRNNKECDLKILAALPEDKKTFEVVGKCKGRGGVFIDDGSEKAFDRVEKCACKHGGNAIVLSEFKRTGFNSGSAAGPGFNTYSSTGGAYEATVIRLN